MSDIFIPLNKYIDKINYIGMEDFDTTAVITQFIREGTIVPVSESATDYDLIDMFLSKHTADSAFFIVDLSKLITQVKKWMDAFPRITPYYAVKSNPDDILCKILGQLECNFDVASRNEIKQILDCEVNPNRIIYANPIKTSNQIAYARSQDVDLLVFDCETELLKIKLHHPYASLILRLKVDDTGSICRFSEKFGCHMSDVQGLINCCKYLKLNLVGVSFHVGSGCSDPKLFVQAIINAKNTFKIGSEAGFNMNILDIGGGFSVDTFTDYIEPINNALDDFLTEFEQTKVIAEPGRFFVSNSHLLVLQVIGKKNLEDGFVYYLNEGVYGSLNCIIFDHKKLQIFPYSERDSPKKYKSTMYGPTCDSMDKICHDYQLPELTIGETIFIPDVGAYTRSASSRFNGFDIIPCYYVFRG